MKRARSVKMRHEECEDVQEDDVNEKEVIQNRGEREEGDKTLSDGGDGTGSEKLFKN